MEGQIKLEDFYDWVKIHSDEDDSEYILKFLNYVTESSKKSDTYLNTLWQTISGSRNLSVQGFPNEGSINFVDNVNYDINTTTCSYNIYFNKVIFDDSINLDDHLSEEKLKQYNKGKTSKGGGSIKNLILLNKTNKLKTHKTNSIKKNLIKIGLIKFINE